MTDATAIISEDEPPKIDDIVEAYVGIRDSLGDARKKFKAYEAQCKADMLKLEVKLLEISRQLGVDSFKTKFGTAFKTDKDFARVSGPEGWEALCKYMVENNDFGLVEKRVAKLHFKEVMATEAEKEENGLAPIEMGVEYVVEEVIQVRRS